MRNSVASCDFVVNATTIDRIFFLNLYVSKMQSDRSTYGMNNKGEISAN